MKRNRWKFCQKITVCPLFFFLMAIVVFPVQAQEFTDYSKATHWTGGIVFGQAMSSPLVLGDHFLVVLLNGEMKIVDVSDPYNPVLHQTGNLYGTINNVFGPHEGVLYCAGPDFIRVVDAETLNVLSLIFHPNVSQMEFGDSYGVMVTGGSNNLVFFDPTLPLELPEISSVPGDGFYSAVRNIALHGDLVYLSTIFRGVLVIDASDLAMPEVMGSFGWLWEPVTSKSTSLYHETRAAFVAGDVFSFEYYHYHDSSENYNAYQGYITRWDLQDLDNPDPVIRGTMEGGHLAPLSNVFCTYGDEILNVIGSNSSGSRIISTDLSSPGLDRSFVKGALGIPHQIQGIVQTENILAVTSSNGALNFFQNQQPGGPEPLSLNGGGQLDGALAENRAITLGGQSGLPTDCSAIVFDTTDPDNPVSIASISSMYNLRYCAVSEKCAALYSPDLKVINLESGVAASSSIEVSSFIFVQPTLGVLVNEAGLFVVDCSDPENLVTLAHPWTEPLISLTSVPGHSSLVVALDYDGNLQVWNVENPAFPILISSCNFEIETLVSQGGRANSLLTVIRANYEGWPGATLQLVDLSNPLLPILAGILPLPALPENAWLEEFLLYLACGYAGLIIVDVADPMNPVIHGGLATDPINAVMVDGGHLLLQGLYTYVLPLDESSMVPVMVSGFWANDGDAVVNLNWQVHFDEAIPEFRILRKSNGVVVDIPVQHEGENWTALDDTPPWGEIVYRLEQKMDESEGWFFLQEISITRKSPLVARLLPPSPNPFNPMVSLVCELPQEGHFRICVFDISGRVVKVLFDGNSNSGRFSLQWDGTDIKGHLLPSGTYIAKLTSGGNSATQKLLLVR